jgi:hypothetical protein
LHHDSASDLDRRDAGDDGGGAAGDVDHAGDGAAADEDEGRSLGDRRRRVGHGAREAAGVSIAEDGGRLASDEDGWHTGAGDDAGMGGGISDAGGWRHLALLSERMAN